MSPSPVIIGVSLKAYFGREQAHAWLTAAADIARSHPAVTTGAVQLFVVPTYLQIPQALAVFQGLPVLVGAQDVSEFEPGPYTGEVTAAELAELGVTLAEIGHAERRSLLTETDQTTAAKAAAALNHGLTPVLCVGEQNRCGPTAAATSVVAQLRRSLMGAPAGPVIVAYEPVWAIGTAEPAPAAHIENVTRTLRATIDSQPDRDGSVVIYGGSAGPGLLGDLGDAVDGLFLGRFAHDTRNLTSVLDEVARRVRTVREEQ